MLRNNLNLINLQRNSRSLTQRGLFSTAPQSTKINFGPKSVEIFHPSDVIAYLAFNKLLSTRHNGSLSLENHMAGLNKYANNLNCTQEEYASISKECAKQSLFNRIGLTLKFPELFEFANKCYQIQKITIKDSNLLTSSQFPSYVESMAELLDVPRLQFGLKTNMSPSDLSEALMNSLHQKIESEFGDGLRVRPYEEAEMTLIQFLHYYIRDHLPKSDVITEKDRFHQNQDILLEYAKKREQSLLEHTRVGCFAI